MTKEELKLRLIKLIAGLERKDALDYFYRIIASELYRSNIIPKSEMKETVAFVEKWEEEMKEKDDRQREQRECRDSIKSIINGIESKESLDKLKAIIEMFCAC